jgi:outer membrane protein OmpA-like peptidoglycan-associated protein
MTFASHRRTSIAVSASILVAAAVGCGASPAPPELLDARSAYIKAQSGPASQFKPDQLHEAKVALDKAEQSYSDDPGEQKTRDIAYVAERRAELADVAGRDAKAAMDRVQAEKDIQALTQNQLSQARQQLSSTGQALAGTQQALAGSQQQLAGEKQAREAADKRAREAMDRLAASAAGSVRQDTRGTIITIPGSVLFASNKSTLLPAAQVKLNAVADALKDQSDRMITIEGHTDSQGTDASNQELSQNRAQAVRDYLVSRGIKSEGVKAQGVGSSRPVADNASPEGRANNRRVEIVVQNIEAK